MYLYQYNDGLTKTCMANQKLNKNTPCNLYHTKGKRYIAHKVINALQYVADIKRVGVQNLNAD